MYNSKQLPPASVFQWVLCAGSSDEDSLSITPPIIHTAKHEMSAPHQQLSVFVKLFTDSSVFLDTQGWASWAHRQQRSFKVVWQQWGFEDCATSGAQGKAPGGGSGAKPPRSWRHFFMTIGYFEPVLWFMHDYMNQFNMKWTKNQYGGRKVVGQATKLDH